MLELQRKWPFGLTGKNKWRLPAGGVLLFAALLALDSPVTTFVRTLPPEIIAPFHIITRLGNSDWILVPSLVVALVAGLLAFVPGLKNWSAAFRRSSAIAAFYFVGVAGPGLVATLIKRIVGRARPVHFEQWGIWHFQPNLAAWDFQSFPSGDTTTIFAFATITALLWPRLSWPAFTLAVLVGLSRIMVGMHYPTDVLGGVLVGTLGAIAVRNLFARQGWLFEESPAGRLVRKA